MNRYEITDRDIAFVEQAKAHYEIFADASQDERLTGIFRKQAFYAERFLIRLRAALAP